MIDSNPNSAVPSRSELLPLSRSSELEEATLSIEDGMDLRMPEPLLKIKEKAKLAKKRFTERNHKNKSKITITLPITIPTPRSDSITQRSHLPPLN